MPCLRRIFPRVSPRRKATSQLGDERERVSLDCCRRLLGPDCALSDSDLTALRNQLYTLAELVVSLTPDAGTREAMIERSAIMEAEGMPRSSADEEAALLHLRGRLQ